MTSVTLPHQRPGAAATKHLGTLGSVEVRDLAHLKANPLNPRGPVSKDDPKVIELSRSISANGLRSPILILNNGIIIAGHRRKVACEIAGLTRVRVIVTEDLAPDQQLELMLIENVQREDLSPVQEAAGYKGLLDRNRKLADISRAVGKSLTHINARLAILELTPEVQRLFARRQLPIGAAALLAKLGPDKQREWADKAVQSNWTVEALRQTLDPQKKPVVQSRPVAQKGAGNSSSGPTMTSERAVASIVIKKGALSAGDIVNARAAVSCECDRLSGSAKEKACSNCPLPGFLVALLHRFHDVGGGESKVERKG